MELRSGWEATAVLLLLLAVSVPGVAMQAQDGDEKCDLSGHQLRYRDGRGWVDLGKSLSCAGPSAGRDDGDGRRSRDRDRDRDSDDDGRRNSTPQRSSAYDGGGEPADGDEKCGPDNYILKYDRASLHRWTTTLRRCGSR